LMSPPLIQPDLKFLLFNPTDPIQNPDDPAAPIAALPLPFSATAPMN
jgi:hypothetical protein